MDCIREYLNSLPIERREPFAKRCGTTVGYLRKAVSLRQQLGAKVVVGLEKHSDGAIRCEQVLPDVDWAFLRGTKRGRN